MILIVDDNRQVRAMIRSIIEDLDENIRECEDGVDALDAFHTHHPDWVLMDIAMPRMNGLEATREIIAAFPDAKIAIVTQHDDVETRRAARKAGACAYFVKENLTDLRRVFTDPNCNT